jgi:hypothetical protein
MLDVVQYLGLAPIKNGNLYGAEIEITPEMARELLSLNEANRRLRSQDTAEYGRQMREGKWYLNGEPIVFDKNHKLRNGQHRLEAIARGVIAIRVLVIWGVDPEVVISFDQNIRRNYADLLKFQGVPHSGTINGALVYVYRYENGGLDSYRSPRNPDRDECLAQHPDLPDAVEESLQWKELQNPLGLNRPVAAGIYYILRKNGGDRAREFFTKLASGADLAVDTPIYTLRKRLEAGKPKGKGGPRVRSNKEVMAHVIRAWNAFIEGRPLKRLKFDPNEEFPVILTDRPAQAA